MEEQGIALHEEQEKVHVTSEPSEAAEAQTQEPASEPIEESASEPVQVDYDFGSVFNDDFNLESVPESYRLALESVRQGWETRRTTAREQMAEVEKQAQRHRELWQQLLRDENPERFSEFEQQLRDLKIESENRQRIIDALTEERDAVQSQFKEHTTQSNEQYLTWVEKKWHDNLVADAGEGNPVLKSAEEMIVELQFDPDDALELGFNYGIEAMAEAADFCFKGMQPQDAYDLAKRIYSSFAEEPQAPEATPPAQEVAATHSPAADLAEPEVMPTARAPERTNREPMPAGVMNANNLDSFLRSTAQDLFRDIRFRKR